MSSPAEEKPGQEFSFLQACNFKGLYICAGQMPLPVEVKRSGVTEAPVLWAKRPFSLSPMCNICFSTSIFLKIPEKKVKQYLIADHVLFFPVHFLEGSVKSLKSHCLNSTLPSKKKKTIQQTTTCH